MSKPPITNPNRKPADDLADVRMEIRKLKEKEDYLRRKILDGEFSTEGDEHRVIIKKSEQKRFDKKAAENELGELLDKFKSVHTITALVLKPVDQ